MTKSGPSQRVQRVDTLGSTRAALPSFALGLGDAAAVSVTVSFAASGESEGAVL
jgi:hypothetical protein